MWRHMICSARQAHRARRLDELEPAVAQELGAHVVRQADPAEEREQDQQQQIVGVKIAAKMISR